MTFLPIVERELRVAARKRNTFWLRIVAALVALLIGGGFLVLTMTIPFGTTQLGSVLFGLLTWLSLAAALSAGLFFTSDCVSEEKREGTLGFLFLTDLRGYDVVLGKLLATSLRSFFALLAIFPILAITMLMGGVTAPQFWKTLLALVNALFCSLAVGMFVSSISRDSQKALGATLCLLLLLLFAGPTIDRIVDRINGRPFSPFLSLCSPGYVFICADRWGDTYWRGLLINQMFVWLLLGLACVLVPRTWQQRRARSTVSHGSWSYAWRYGGVQRRSSLRRKLLSRSPVLWLACRERWQSLLIWAVTLFVLTGFSAVLLSGLPTQVWFIWNYVGSALTLIFYLGTASQAGRFFVEARRSGLIELLLAAPLNGREIVHGQWRALLRLFALPATLFLCVQFAAQAISSQATWGALGITGGAGGEELVAIFSGFVSAVVVAANLIALCWFGMWMGMTSKSANFATLKTALFVQVIPWFAITFASSLLSFLVVIPMLAQTATGSGPKAASAGPMAWFPFLSTTVAGVLALGKDSLFVVLARRKLYSQFREMAARVVAPLHVAPPRPRPRPIAAPPKIPAPS
jgi:ABC-type transport system involved in cytochrome c biogenesis permease component